MRVRVVDEVRFLKVEDEGQGEPAPTWVPSYRGLLLSPFLKFKHCYLTKESKFECWAT